MKLLGRFGVNLQIYKGKRVLVTGDTGFKGSWLVLWLEALGAQVLGVSDSELDSPSHYNILNTNYESLRIDIRNKQKLNEVVKSFKPEVIFHLAAQSLVRDSYINPIETLETNIMGTANLLDSCRNVLDSVKAVVCVTSDKCYENKEQNYFYKESDPMGGYDPYSVSKGCAELVISSFTRSFFNHQTYKSEHHCLVASVRAGNVIGGGDWAKNRLIPDIFRSYEKNEAVVIKNPHAVRPWQHVLEPLCGYLKLGEQLLQENLEMSCGWNFGPKKESCIKVGEILSLIQGEISDFKYEILGDKIHEAKLLMLDSSKAEKKLGWQPKLGIAETIKWTARWYKSYIDKNDVITKKQLFDYMQLAEL